MPEGDDPFRIDTGAGDKWMAVWQKYERLAPSRLFERLERQAKEDKEAKAQKEAAREKIWTKARQYLQWRKPHQTLKAQFPMPNQAFQNC